MVLYMRKVVHKHIPYFKKFQKQIQAINVYKFLESVGEYIISLKKAIKIQ